MGLLNFLAASKSLRGLVARRAHRVMPPATLIPNFNVAPEVAERVERIRGRRRDEDPFALAKRATFESVKTPKFRSTFRPETIRPNVQTPLVAPVPTVEEPRPGGQGTPWMEKLRMARREAVSVVNGKQGNGQRQFRRPAAIQSQPVPRRQRLPSWMTSGAMKTMKA